MSRCTCGRGEVFHPPFHDEACEMYERPVAKPDPVVVLADALNGFAMAVETYCHSTWIALAPATTTGEAAQRERLSALRSAALRMREEVAKVIPE